jgi:hypothetical protein
MLRDVTVKALLRQVEFAGSAHLPPVIQVVGERLAPTPIPGWRRSYVDAVTNTAAEWKPSLAVSLVCPPSPQVSQ